MDYKKHLAIALTSLMTVIQASYSYELLDIDCFAQSKASDWNLIDPMYLKLRNDTIPLFLYQENDPPEEDNGKKKPRKRTVFTEAQLSGLKRAYATNPRPSALEKDRLCKLIGINPKVHIAWFRNKRCKDKKKGIIHPSSSAQTQGAGLATVACDSTSAQHMTHSVQLSDTAPLHHFNAASASASASAETSTIEDDLNNLIENLINDTEENDLTQQHFLEAVGSNDIMVITLSDNSLFLYIPTHTPGVGLIIPISDNCQIRPLFVTYFSVVSASNPATPQQGSLTLPSQQIVPFTVNQGLTQLIPSIYREIVGFEILKTLEYCGADPHP